MINIILDLDETLISSVDNAEYNQYKETLDKMNLESKKLSNDDDDFEYIVYKTNLQMFLDFYFSK